MPIIHSLQIQRFRNLTAVEIETSSRFNLFYGKNGSGKTSLLEAIYYLGLGRSFRTHLVPRLIQHDTESFSIFANLYENDRFLPLGVERLRQGDRHLKINGETAASWSPIAKQLPLRILSAMSHRFLLDGPKIRRQFLDWLLFHVEPTFFPLWQQLQQALKQRNAALKSRLPHNQISFWDETFINAANSIDQLRQQLIIEFQPVFLQVLSQLLPEFTLQMNYYRGWGVDETLEQRLSASFSRDLQVGYTQYGPHRADLPVLLENTPAQDILSQGQQKLVTCALHLAQGLLLQQKTGISPIYLIDDLPAELDEGKRAVVSATLHQLDAQVFVTGITIEELSDLADSENRALFHVEHGKIQQPRIHNATSEARPLGSA
jgi:DNA replication and repair protein RecF